MVAIYVTIDQFDDFNIFTKVTEGRFEPMNFPEKMSCNSFLNSIECKLWKKINEFSATRLFDRFIKY